MDSLDGVDVREGEVYKRSTLEKVKSELVRSYASNGRYGANVDIQENIRPRNTIEISIEVDEGKSATIKKIDIIGNEVFASEDLLDGFELSEGSLFSFLSNDNQYSREKLQGDIESLESFYLDRGYLKFSIESSQISLSRDKKSIFISFNIFEGDEYKISTVNVIGDLPFDENAYLPITSSQEGQIYSQGQITAIEEYFKNILGNQGYAFAEVTGVPVTNDEDKTK